MNYFTLIPDKACPLVRIYNHTEVKIFQAVMRGEADQIPDGTVFQLKEVPDSGMPDILFKPIFCVSQLFYKCIRIYHPYITAVQISFVDCRNHFTYYILELPSADKKEAFSLYEQHIYKTTDNGVETVEVSLDLSESLLRRGVWGFGLKEGK